MCPSGSPRFCSKRGCRGSEVKHTGDGIMVSFVSTTQAVDCATSIHQNFQRYNRGNAEPIHIRIGIDCGEPVKDSNDLFGTTVQLAARLCSTASADQIMRWALRGPSPERLQRYSPGGWARRLYEHGQRAGQVRQQRDHHIGRVLGACQAHGLSRKVIISDLPIWGIGTSFHRYRTPVSVTITSMGMSWGRGWMVLISCVVKPTPIVKGLRSRPARVLSKNPPP